MKLQTEQMQVTTIKIEVELKKINIVLSYLPPSFNLKKENYKWMLQELSKCFILGGDFNAKNRDWGI